MGFGFTENSMKDIVANSPAANAGIVLPAKISRVNGRSLSTGKEILDAVRLVDGCELYLCIVSDAPQLGGTAMGGRYL